MFLLVIFFKPGNHIRRIRLHLVSRSDIYLIIKADLSRAAALVLCQKKKKNEADILKHLCFVFNKGPLDITSTMCVTKKGRTVFTRKTIKKIKYFND